MRYLPTNQIWRYWSFEKFLEDISSLGVTDIDLWLCNQHVNIDACDVYNARAVAESVGKRGIHVRTLTPEQSNPKAYNIASLDKQIQKLTRGYYENVVRLGARLGVKRISLNGGWFLFDDDPSKAWDAMVSTLTFICHRAAQEGIDVCIEPLSKARYRLVMDEQGLSRVLEEVNEKNLYATLDTGTIARNGEELGSYVRAFKDRIGYVHLTNIDPKMFAHLGWGDSLGVLDPCEVLATLQAGGYTGDCALEMTKSSYYECPRAILARSIETLKGCER